MPKNPKTLFHRTDLGNAERFTAQHGDNVRWCQAWKSWLYYNGKYWEKDQTGQVDRLAKATVRAIYQEAAEEPDETVREKLVKHALASESNRAIRALLERAKSELPVEPKAFDTHLSLLNCHNGTLDLRTGELHPHRPQDMLTRCLTINYTPHTPCPRWEAFISQVLANQTELIAFIQQALGMSLSGDTSEQCLFICHGLGSNGKTTMLETVRIILGSYGLAANIETFQIHKFERINNDVAELYGARFVTASENALGSRLNEAFIKKATGKEPLRARHLRAHEFEFMPEFTIWFAVNHKPMVKDTSEGMWRRVHFIPFTVTIKGDQVDKRFGEKLLEEAEGVLAWLVRGCLSWYAAGRLTVPQIVEQATQAYCEEMDLVKRYLAARCEQDDHHAAVGAIELYHDYKRWCEASGERSETQKTFGDRLTELGYHRERRHAATSKITVYLGLRLLPPEEPILSSYHGQGGHDGQGDSHFSLFRTEKKSQYDHADPVHHVHPVHQSNNASEALWGRRPANEWPIHRPSSYKLHAQTGAECESTAKTQSNAPAPPSGCTEGQTASAHPNSAQGSHTHDEAPLEMNKGNDTGPTHHPPSSSAQGQPASPKEPFGRSTLTEPVVPGGTATERRKEHLEEARSLYDFFLEQVVPGIATLAWTLPDSPFVQEIVPTAEYCHRIRFCLKSQEASLRAHALSDLQDRITAGIHAQNAQEESPGKKVRRVL